VARKVNGILVLELLDQRLDANIANDFKVSMANVINEGNHILILNLSPSPAFPNRP
jgi:hypothetical protein